MEQKRKIYSVPNGVLAIIGTAAITLMILSLYQKIGEGFFFVICPLILVSLLYLYALQLYSKMTRRQWAGYVTLAFCVPNIVVLPLVRGFMADESYSEWQEFGTTFIAILCAVFVISGIYSLIFNKKPKMRKKIVAGNWKMNTLPAEGVELAKGVAAGRATVASSVNLIVCPPFTHISEVVKAVAGSNVEVGAQNCAAEEKGAYTGEVAASMIAALGCKYVILGHSERRQYYGETSATLNAKMTQAYANGLTPIYCVGENLEEREAGKHFEVVKSQIEEVVFGLTEEQFANLVIAYEPVWAIGTGKTATAEQAQEIHAYIREVLRSKFGEAAELCPILYGGSCKPSNAAEIFAKADVDGGLIGGAALKADDFLAIGKGFE